MIETERLILRHWEKDDAEPLFRLANDHAVADPAGWPAHTSVNMSKEVIETVFNDVEVYAIVLKSTNDIIGCIGATFDKTCPISPEERVLGYWVGKDYFNNGYTTEAANTIVEHIFQTYHCPGIWCGNFPDNIASARVQEKCGFVFHHIDYDKNWGMPDEGRKVEIRYLINPQKSI